MTNGNGSQPENTASSDLQLFFSTLWQGRYFIAIVAVVLALAGLALTFLFEPKFDATSRVLIREQSSPSALSQLAGSLGAAASLAGVSLGGESDERTRTLALLNSRTFAVKFIRMNGLLEDVYPVSAIERKGGPEEIDWKLAEIWFEDILSIREDAGSGLLFVTARWTDPDTAAALANDYVVAADNELKTESIERANNNIEFLSQKIVEFNIVSVQNTIASLIEAELRNQMLASQATPQSLEIVDRAIPVHEVSFPSRPLFCVAFLIIGTFLSSTIVLFRSYLRAS